MKKSAVFLDRDGTLIEDPGYLSDPDQVRLLPGAASAVRRLNEAGCLVIVVSNQSGVARGLITESDVDAIHERLRTLLAAEDARIDAVYYCPFFDGPEAIVEKYRRDSDLRKPNPGMLLLAAKEHPIDLKSSWMIGDKDSDVLAGRSAGCRTILIETSTNPPRNIHPHFTAGSLPTAVEIVLQSVAR